jgi:hypothetical protein
MPGFDDRPTVHRLDLTYNIVKMNAGTAEDMSSY